ncbi:predicted protein [Uncinocarpus reesii 1704]|uniref:ABC a-pheromone efflux pump AtrD n=1 Tax=Uncinocarpus reesii (strain UAMH 1704) TaxID=336963 RepID=C4JG94_UNCRE|nr:uncharacterized protein UREG_02492 [Uncinocarpus reesii 1704]EEP77643.1 predicted protein [Uncinocarpus reesii 1704]
MAPETSYEASMDQVSSLQLEPKREWKFLFYFTTRRHLVPLIGGLIFTVAGGLTVPLLAVLLGRVFNELTNFGAHAITATELMDTIARHCIYLVALGFAIWLFQAIHFSLWIVFGELQAKRARDELFGELLCKETKWFDLTPDGVGALLPRIQAHVRDFQLAVSQPLGSILQNLVASITGLVLALCISWNLTLVCLATVPICAFIIGVISTKVQPEIDAQRLELDRASKLAISAISSIDVVKQLNGEAMETDNYMSAIQAAAKHYLKQARLTAIEIGSINLLTFGMFVQGFGYGGYLVATGKLNPGRVLTTFWACLQATQSIESIVPQLLVLEKGRAAATALKHILGHVQKPNCSPGSNDDVKSPQFCEGNIKFENVTFAYPSQPDRLVLDNCSFYFPAGDMTFIVGKSGSGKSTLGNLLLRFYAPASGEILIDGNPIGSLDISWVRNNITLVQQQSSLFNESILRNVAFGARDSTQVKPDDIANCISLASLRDTIQAMPEGLDTVVGLSGSRLSGGQRQRVALARSRLRDTPILILDESTSALDYYTRISIMNSIREWRKGRTTIIITHDLSQIKDNDFVYMVDKGKVSRQGYKQTLEGGSLSAVSPAAGDNSLGGFSYIDRKGPNRPQSLPAKPTSLDCSIDSRSPLVFSPAPYSPILRQSHILQQSQFVRQPNQPGSSGIAERNDHVAIEVTSRQVRESSLNPEKGKFEETIKSPASEHFEETQPLRDRFSPSGTSLLIHRPGSLFKALCTVLPSLSRTDTILLALGFVAAFFHAAATPAFAFLFSRLLSTFYVTENRVRAALQYALGILGVSVGNGVASFWMHYLLERCGHAWIDRLRQRAMGRILQQPKPWFEKDSSHASTLTSYLDHNAEEMRNLVGRFAGFMFVAAVMMAMGTIWGMVLCWRLTLVGCACAPVLGYWEGRCNRASEVVAGIFSETFLDIRTVRSLTLESYFHRKHFRANTETLTIGMKRGCYTGFMFGLSEASITFVYVPQISASRDTATQVLQLASLSNDSSHEFKGQMRILHPVPIKFTGVKFSYPAHPDKPVLCDFNLTINENTCTAIVGPSGSGKSTIASLLLALYPTDTTRAEHPTDQGLITLGGVDLREIHVPTLRSVISIVPQQPTIFPTTIRDNISYGLEESSFYNTQANVRAAAKAAGIDDFISSLPSGYDTIIGDGGVGLSGGQAQRLVIARALIRRPRILILDEATSSLDVESAAGIKRTVSKLMGMRDGRRGDGLTVIIITHEREMMEVADRVVVVGQGRVVEEGSFGELVDRRGGELRRLLRVNECI